MTYNIVFIMPDQLRADFIGCYGADFVQTPHIDGLAEQGVRYQWAISPSPICVPARAALLTGRNAIRNGVIDNSHWLRPDDHEMGITTWAEDLHEAGCQTAAIGKMHFYPWDISEGLIIALSPKINVTSGYKMIMQIMVCASCMAMNMRAITKIKQNP